MGTIRISIDTSTLGDMSVSEEVTELTLGQDEAVVYARALQRVYGRVVQYLLATGVDKDLSTK